MKNFILIALAYIVPTMLLGMVWHFVWFHELYEKLGMYNRAEPIIPLGMSSMIIQGLIIAYLYPYYAKDKSTIKTGLKFSLLMGLFLFSVTTLANAAKIEVTSLQQWLIIQLAFHLIQFTIAGVFIGLIKTNLYTNT